jgi:DNA invertase Pin-like site-specific DNA recombinase
MRAAQYVRMSTEHQRYSIANQKDVIAEYAARHAMAVVRTYADDGISGLRLENRRGLQKLLSDVITGQADFETILVLDVTRWGRFQDTDESAAYEFMCRKAGVAVVYCAESFDSESDLLTSVLKAVKRSMAAEYSRELSEKVYRGQCRIAARGYSTGGRAGYGLRRMLIDEHGRPKGILQDGQQKSISADRVTLVLGPRREVGAVRRMFRLFVHKKFSPADIARELNEAGIKTRSGCFWTRNQIMCILTSEKYAGSQVYNRSSFKLQERRIRLPPSRWILTKSAFEPIVPPELFEEAQRRLGRQTSRLSDQQLLQILRQLLMREGRLSLAIIEAEPNVPSFQTYRYRFGSLRAAYAKIGYFPADRIRRAETHTATTEVRRGVVSALLAGLRGANVPVAIVHRHRVLRVDDQFAIEVASARYEPGYTGEPRWMLDLKHRKDADLTLAVRLDRVNRGPLDFYLLPRFVRTTRILYLGTPAQIWCEAFRCGSLDVLFEIVSQARARKIPFATGHADWARRNLNSSRADAGIEPGSLGVPI